MADDDEVSGSPLGGLEQAVDLRAISRALPKLSRLELLLMSVLVELATRAGADDRPTTVPRYEPMASAPLSQVDIQTPLDDEAYVEPSATANTEADAMPVPPTHASPKNTELPLPEVKTFRKVMAAGMQHMQAEDADPFSRVRIRQRSPVPTSGSLPTEEDLELPLSLKPHVTGGVAAPFDPDILRKIPKFDELTNRENEVLRFIAIGATNKEAGRALNISPRTVEVHRARLMTKFRADTMGELIFRVLSTAVKNTDPQGSDGTAEKGEE